MKFQTTIQNYNPKSLVEQEIFAILSHEVEQILHFTQVTEIVHPYFVRNIIFQPFWHVNS